MSSLIHRLPVFGPAHRPCPKLRRRLSSLLSLSSPPDRTHAALPPSSRAAPLLAQPHHQKHPALTSTSGLPPPSPPSQPERSEEEISDQEWEIRTGRAIYILQQTLPDFFETGLISSLALPSVSSPAAPAASAWSLPWLTLGLAPKRLGAGTGNANGNGKGKVDDAEESIYSPRVRLMYTPPTPLPAPFPQTLSIEGLHLYIASSIFVRHTLNALNTDLRVELRRVRVFGSRDSNGNKSTNSPPPPPPPPTTTTKQKRSRSAREKSISISLAVIGLGRVSRAPVEWQVTCTYTFSPLTGLIMLHTVDSIEPAPHHALFEALGKFGLLGGIDGGPGAAGKGAA